MPKQTKPATPQSMRIIQSDNFLSVYSNNAQVQVSAFDVRLVFGEGSPVDENTQQIEQKVAVIMSLHHAKAFAQILFDNVKNYEQQVGELKLPGSPITRPGGGSTPRQ